MRYRTPRHVDPRDIDPFGGNDELRERAEKAYDATIAREKDLVEGSAALNSTSGAHPHTPSPTESRNTTQGEAMAATPPALRIEAPTTPKEYEDVNAYYAKQVDYIRSLPPSPMTDTECEEMRKVIKVRVDGIMRWFDPLVSAAFNAHRALTGRRTQATAGLLACDDACRIKIGEHARLQRIEAEKERLRKEAIERQRRADEAKAQAEALAAQAADAEKAGDAMQAEMLMEEAQRVEQAPIAPVVLPPVEIAKPQGSVVVAKKKVDMSKLDKVTLLVHCLGATNTGDLFPNESLIVEILEFKEGAINRLLNKGISLPGVVFYETDEVRSKGR